MGREHRGADPEDRRAFAPTALPALRAATADLGWLLGRGYAPDAALKLVGDRFQLTARQRMAVRRSAASDGAVADRLARRVALDDLDGRLLVDGFNVLITVERALGGGAVLVGRDGVCRDLAGVHGTWRAVAQTERALVILGEALERCGSVAWRLDRPVSNSGRLAGELRRLADERGWRWDVAVVDAPDRELAEAGCAVATGDAGILDRCGPWVNLVRDVLADRVPDAWLVDLGVPAVV